MSIDWANADFSGIFGDQKGPDVVYGTGQGWLTPAPPATPATTTTTNDNSSTGVTGLSQAELDAANNKAAMDRQLQQQQCCHWLGKL